LPEINVCVYVKLTEWALKLYILLLVRFISKCQHVTYYVVFAVLHTDDWWLVVSVILHAVTRRLVLFYEWM